MENFSHFSLPSLSIVLALLTFISQFMSHYEQLTALFRLLVRKITLEVLRHAHLLLNNTQGFNS